MLIKLIPIDKEPDAAAADHADGLVVGSFFLPPEWKDAETITLTLQEDGTFKYSVDGSSVVDDEIGAGSVALDLAEEPPERKGAAKSRKSKMKKIELLKV